MSPVILNRLNIFGEDYRKETRLASQKQGQKTAISFFEVPNGISIPEDITE
jgi:hypothetical protein